MKFLLAALAIFSLTAEARPLAEWQNATVQVQSFPCVTERPRFTGSGLLVAVGEEIYVLTSEHVVIQDSSARICHEASGLFGAEKTVLVSADYLMGLALLRVVNPAERTKSAAVPLAELSNRKGSSLAALGFPSGSDQLQTLLEGKVITASSRRALIAGVAEMIEASNLPVEYGMSGGVLLAGEGSDFSFLGVLSHQILRREGGRPSNADDINPGEPGNTNDLALAIPALTARNWIVNANKNQVENWRRDPNAQLEGKDAVAFGPLLFTLKQKAARDVWDVGGADGSGIGGGDGSGIGGDSGGMHEGEAEQLHTVEITLNPSAEPALKAKAFSNISLEQWRNWLLQGKTVEAVFLRNANAKRLQKIGSLAQFFTFWQRDKLVPLAVRSKVGEQKADSEVLNRLARHMAGQAQAARDRSENAEMKAWFSMLRDFALLAQDGLIPSKELLGVLQGPNDIYWRRYYDAEFEAAVALEASIQNLAQQMKKMGI